LRSRVTGAVGGVAGAGDAGGAMRRGCRRRGPGHQPCSGRLWTTGGSASPDAGNGARLWTTRSGRARDIVAQC